MSEINEVLKFNGLKCDHCDWEDKDIPYAEFEGWVDKPCPKCGENVLTQEDYNQVKELVEVITKAMETVKNMSPEERAELEANAPKTPVNIASIGFSLEPGGGFSMDFKYKDIANPAMDLIERDPEEVEVLNQFHQANLNFYKKDEETDQTV